MSLGQSILQNPAALERLRSYIESHPRVAIHAQIKGNCLCIWDVQRIWSEARRLPTIWVSLDELHDFWHSSWFPFSSYPTYADFAGHVKRVLEADLECPVILSESGQLMDGMHRLVKCHSMGYKDVLAKRFPHDPAPSEIIVI